MKSKEQTKEQELRAQIKELKAALVDLQLDKVANQSYLELACEQLKCSVEDFKKKSKLKR